MLLPNTTAPVALIIGQPLAPNWVDLRWEYLQAKKGRIESRPDTEVLVGCCKYPSSNLDSRQMRAP